jgi:hypothetical protein
MEVVRYFWYFKFTSGLERSDSEIHQCRLSRYSFIIFLNIFTFLRDIFCVRIVLKSLIFSAHQNLTVFRKSLANMVFVKEVCIVPEYLLFFFCSNHASKVYRVLVVIQTLANGSSSREPFHFKL